MFLPPSSCQIHRLNSCFSIHLESGFGFSTKAAGLLLSATFFSKAFTYPTSRWTTSGWALVRFCFSPISLSRSQSCAGSPSLRWSFQLPDLTALRELSR